MRISSLVFIALTLCAPAAILADATTSAATPPAFAPVTAMMPADPAADFMASVEAAELRGDYAWLEQTAQTLRASDTRFAGGAPKIVAFYAALGRFDGCGCDDLGLSLASHAAKAKAIAAWRAAGYRSPTANIAAARLLRTTAWAMRGHAWAPDTPDAQLQSFADLNRESVDILRGLDPRSDPAIYVGLISAARGSDTGRADLDRILPAAIAAFPTCYTLYENAADMLQERWFGATGDAASFLAGLTHSGETELVAYAAAVGRLDRSNASTDLPALFHIDWPVLRHAFDVRRRLYGTSLTLQNEEMKMAVVFGDRATAARLLGQIGPAWSPTVWQRQSAFIAAAAWVDNPAGPPPRLD